MSAADAGGDEWKATAFPTNAARYIGCNGYREEGGHSAIEPNENEKPSAPDPSDSAESDDPDAKQNEKQISR